MNSASTYISQAWKFALAAVIIMCAEVLLPCFVYLCVSCAECIESNRDYTQVYHDNTDAKAVNEDRLTEIQEEFNPDKPPVEGENTI